MTFDLASAERVEYFTKPNGAVAPAIPSTDFVFDGAVELDEVPEDYKHQPSKPTDFMTPAVELTKSIARSTEAVGMSLSGAAIWSVESAESLYSKAKKFVFEDLKMEKAPGDVERFRKIDEAFARAKRNGRRHQKWWTKQMQTGWEAAHPGLSFKETPLSFTASVVGEAIPMFGAAVATTYATGNPWAGAAIFGADQFQSTYVRATDMGLDYSQATTFAALDAAVTIALESAGQAVVMKGGSNLSRLLGKKGTDVFKKLPAFGRGAIEGGAVETFTEILQTVNTNLIAKYGYDKGQRIFEGTLEAGLGGFVLGSTGTGISAQAQHNAGVRAKNLEQQIVESSKELPLAEEETPLGEIFVTVTPEEDLADREVLSSDLSSLEDQMVAAGRDAGEAKNNRQLIEQYVEKSYQVLQDKNIPQSRAEILQNTISAIDVEGVDATITAAEAPVSFEVNNEQFLKDFEMPPEQTAMTQEEFEGGNKVRSIMRRYFTDETIKTLDAIEQGEPVSTEAFDKAEKSITEAMVEAQESDIPLVNDFGRTLEADLNQLYGYGRVLAQGERGRFDPSTLGITLTQKADRSTIAHELSHAFLDFYGRYLPEEINAIKGDLGFKGDFQTLSTGEYSRVQEKFADLFENWLKEGKAPSSKLVKVFEDFKKWLAEIYKGIQNIRGVELSDTARQFFNDMVSPDERVQPAKKKVKPKIDETLFDSEFTKKDFELAQSAKEGMKALDKEATKRLRAIDKGAREEILAVQKEIESEINSLSKDVANAAEKAKLKAQLDRHIKNANKKNVQSIIRHLNSLAKKKYEVHLKRELKAQIKKELKGTKPLKKGKFLKERFDYTTSQLFKDLRSFNKMTQKQAEAALNQEQQKTTADAFEAESKLIKTRFLDMKAKGFAESSPALMNKVLSDLKRLKRAGAEAKELADFEKALAEYEERQAVISHIEKLKGDKNTLANKAIKSYIKVQGDTRSAFVSLFGTEFADKYFLPGIQQNKDIAVFNKMTQVESLAQEIYGIKGTDAFMAELSKMNKELNIEGTPITFMRKDGAKTFVTRSILIDMYNSMQNDTRKAQYEHNFGEDIYERVLALMVEEFPNDIDFADALRYELTNYKELLRQRSIDKFGRDPGAIEDYWPASSEYSEVFTDEILRGSETPSFEKTRERNIKVKPIPKDAWTKFYNYVSQAEHIKHVTPTYETLKNRFSDTLIKEKLKEKLGTEFPTWLNKQLDVLSLNHQWAGLDAVSGVVREAVNNWVAAKIASPTVPPKQMVSTILFSEKVDSVTWAKNFMEGLANPKKTWDFMFELDTGLKDRFSRGYNEDIASINKLGTKTAAWSRLNKKIRNLATIGTRAVDVAAIVYGGYGFVQTVKQNSPNMSKADIVKKLRQSYLTGQQSGFDTGLSEIQRAAQKNAFTKIFMAFSNTMNQMNRKVGDAMVAYYRGDIDKKQLAKTVWLYWGTQSLLYEGLSIFLSRAFWGTREEDEVQYQLVKAAILSPTKALPLFGTVASFVYDAMFKDEKVSARDILKLPVLSDLEWALRKATKEDATLGQRLGALATLGSETTLAVPTATGLRLLKRVKGDD